MVTVERVSAAGEAQGVMAIPLGRRGLRCVWRVVDGKLRCAWTVVEA